MTVQQRIVIEDDSHVGEARRTAASFSRLASLSEADAGRVAIIVNELGTNLRKHAKSGELLLRATVRPIDVGQIRLEHAVEGLLAPTASCRSALAGLAEPRCVLADVLVVLVDLVVDLQP